MNETLYLHYQPGARGDFLASVLLDNFTPIQLGRVSRPNGSKYKSRHISDSFAFLDRPDTITMRIVTGPVEDGKWNGTSIAPGIQIVYNWMTKIPGYFENDKHFGPMSLIDRYYHCLHFFLLDDTLADTYKDRYNYRIEFASIDNLEFLESFRIKVMGEGITEKTRGPMLENLAIQKHWQDSADGEVLEQLRILIDSELENGVFLGPTWDHVPVFNKLV